MCYCCGKRREKQSHQDHFAGSRNFYYASRLRGDNFSKPWAPIIVRKWVIYPSGGLCNQGVFAVDGSQVVRKTSQLQRNKLVQSFPSTPLQTVVTVTGNLAGPSWRSVTFWACKKLLVAPRVGNSRQILDTINPRKNSHVGSNTISHWNVHSEVVKM
jgi:hypothetical protein